MRSLSLVAASVLVSTAACSTPERAFPSDDASSTSSSASSSSGGPTASSGGDGDGDGDGGNGGDTSSPASSGSQGGGDPDDCGNGQIDTGETCDEETALCSGCQLDCPPGWFALGSSCFAVALGDIDQYDALTADAKCGALDVAASGHRAHAATPESLAEFDSLATRCVNEGCWLGFYALGPPGEGAFTAPSTNEALFETPPWNDGEPSLADDEVCLKLALTDDGVTILEDQPCGNQGYFACELEVSFGSFATCNDGVLDDGEECDGDADTQCVNCDRRCPAGWSEDPRTHTCLFPVSATGTWDEANVACSDAGARLSTPDDPPDVRIAGAVADDAWIGLDASVPSAPAWVSGEAFDYEAGVFPLSGPPDAASFGLLTGGEIAYADGALSHAALCETFDPDD